MLSHFEGRTTNPFAGRQLACWEQSSPLRLPAKGVTMTELLTDPQAWIAFLTLTALELVLGIDNIIFISILVDKLPAHQRELARRIGLFMAMFMRIGLLFVLSWIIGLTAPMFSILGNDISGRDLILILGGLFLVYKSTHEIHQLLEGEQGSESKTVTATFAAVIGQIMLIDLVFSLDSIITACLPRRSGGWCPTIRHSRCWPCRSCWWSAWC